MHLRAWELTSSTRPGSLAARVARSMSSPWPAGAARGGARSWCGPLPCSPIKAQHPGPPGGAEDPHRILPSSSVDVERAGRRGAVRAEREDAAHPDANTVGRRLGAVHVRHAGVQPEDDVRKQLADDSRTGELRIDAGRDLDRPDASRCRRRTRQTGSRPPQPRT